MLYITTTGAKTVVAGNTVLPTGILITVNAALTGTITVADSNGTQAIITNPTVGAAFRYHGLIGTVTVNSNAVCDITVSNINHQP